MPEVILEGSTAKRLITDHLGSVRMVIDTATGSVVESYAYDAFGVVTSGPSTWSQPFGFAGGLYDATTKLVRFGAREYDAATGRWMSKDPIDFRAGQANLYAYVR